MRALAWKRAGSWGEGSRDSGGGVERRGWRVYGNGAGEVRGGGRAGGGGHGRGEGGFRLVFGFVGSGRKWFGFFGLGFGDGFVPQIFGGFVGEGPEALEILDGAAVEAVGLGLMAEEAAPHLGVDAEEAFGEEEGALIERPAVLLEGFGDLRAEAREAGALDGDGVIEHAGVEAAFEVSDAEAGLLGDGDLLEGEEFLGIAGVVEGDEVRAEFEDLVGIFEEGDVVVTGIEAVFAGILGGAGLALGGAGPGGLGGVGPVGSELFFREGTGWVRQREVS